VVDRVAQRAAQQVIEPLYEPYFLPCSFGFRPGRSTADAIYCARRMRTHGYRWVVDGDIAACFDNLDHKLLMQQVSRRICDERVQALLQLWLNAGILEHDLPEEKPNPFSQGWAKASGNLRQGIDWAIKTMSPKEQYDPYSAARYKPTLEPDYLETESDQIPARDMSGEESDYYQNDYEEEARRNLQKQVLQNVATGGLLLGSSYARQALTKIGPAAIAALKSQAGREVLQHGLLIGGGAVGAAAGVAVTTYLIYRKVTPTSVGVLQGSPISPLLANIYLHSFDVSLTRVGYRLIRYADDWVILCPDQNIAEKAYNQAVVSLAHIQLKVNQEKTHILTPSDRLEWLGEVI
jgi:RNA-directed DNA polymerase